MRIAALSLFSTAVVLPRVNAGPRTHIVLSSGAVPYRRAEEAIRKHLKGRSSDLDVTILADLDPPQVNSRWNQCLVVAVGSPAARWLAAHLPGRVPLIYCMVSHPEKLGLTPRKNTSGVSVEIPLPAQFAFIRQALPRVRKVGILTGPDGPESLLQVERVKAALPDGWQLVVQPIEKVAAARGITALLKRPVDLIWTAPDPAVFNGATIRALLLHSLRAHKPVFGFSRQFVKAGALLGTSIDPAAQGRQAARLAERLLGEFKESPSPAAMALGTAVEPDFQICLNLVVARLLGIRFPDALLDRADYIHRN